jgi:hypothetical protein
VAGGAPLLRDLMRDELEPITTWALTAGTLALITALLTKSVPVAYLTGALLSVGAASQLLQTVNVVSTTVRAGRRLQRQATAEAKLPTGTAKEAP